MLYALVNECTIYTFLKVLICKMLIKIYGCRLLFLVPVWNEDQEFIGFSFFAEYKYEK